MIEVMKALSDENRLRVLHLLSIQPLCVCEVEVLLQMTQSNVSRHLSKLKSAKIIAASKDAQWVHYAIDESFIEAHEKLHGYLLEAFAKEALFFKDKERIESYLTKGLNCTWIAKDKANVLKKIAGED